MRIVVDSEHVENPVDVGSCNHAVLSRNTRGSSQEG